LTNMDKPGNQEIYVVGLGPGDPLQLPACNLSLMRGCQVYLRTGRHPVVPFLEREGIRIRSLDDFYERYTTFDEVYQAMADWLIDTASESQRPVVFAVPGHPLVGESVVSLLLVQAAARGVRVRLWPAPSFLDAVIFSLGLDPAQGLVITESFQLLRCSEGGSADVAASRFSIPPQAGVLIAQVYSRSLASEVKLTLMEHFPDDHLLTVINSAGVRGQERQRRIPLYQLDRLDDLDHLTSVYAPPLPSQLDPAVHRQAPYWQEAGQQALEAAAQADTPAEMVLPSASQFPLDTLVEVMTRLLAPGGCPWDREQTHQSLRQYLIEEAYEVIDAIDEGNMHKLCEELGDLLLQVVFHAALASKRGDFDINRVVAGITAKLKRRHPHVFGEITVNSAAEVVRNWEQIKQMEGAAGAAAHTDEQQRSLLAGVPRYLPSLQRAQKVQGKAALVGFDWPDARSASVKLREEWQELQSAWEAGDRDAIRQEFGDLLFALVNVARLLEVDAEEALRTAVEKFMRRFQGIEAKSAARGLALGSLSLAELDAIWDEVKAEEVTV